ncbi:MAG: M23 family metallopeptidase [Fretibacterium sp.]|nr:M23 family metallopeptidase [Fretibacterium sp.]
MLKLRGKFFALLLLVLLLPRASWGAVVVTCPTSWDIGQVFAVSIMSDKPYKAPVITWLGRRVTLDVERHPPGGFISYALLGSRVRSIKPGNYPLEIRLTQGGRTHVARENVRLRARKYPSENLRVAPRMVTPDKKQLPRIKKEAALAAEAKAVMTSRRLWTTPPLRPVPGAVTSPYGYQRLYNGVLKGVHSGTDFRAAVGTPVKAPFAGRVILTGDHYYAGKSIYLDSGNGVLTLFFHLDSIGVRKGDLVKKGQVIGRSGASGRITGPHLHLGLCLAGQYVDPEPFFKKNVKGLLKGQPRKTIVR